MKVWGEGSDLYDTHAHYTVLVLLSIVQSNMALQCCQILV